MKKLLLIAALSIFAFGSAQITTDAGTFTKPGAGATMFEAQFTPNLNGGTQFGMPEITGGATFMMRKFDSDTKAKRYFANFNFADSGVDGEDSTFGIAAGMGIENHLTGAERLSTYWGYHGLVGFADSGSATTLTLFGGVFLGADYYIVPNVYVGMEFGYGLGISSVDPEGGDATTGFGLNDSVTGNFRLGFRL